MKLGTKAIRVVLLFCLFAAGCEGTFPGKVADKNAPSWVNLETVVRVWREEGPPNKKSLWQGSGVVAFTSPYGSSILTARHVVGAQKEVTIETRSGRRAEGKVIWTHPNHSIDLALVVTPLRLPAMPLSLCEQVKVGDRVFSIANPKGFFGAIGEGEITAILGKYVFTPPTTLQQIEPRIETSAYANLGSSGGALSDAQGKLAGILVAIAEKEPGSGEWQATIAEPIFDSAEEINKALPQRLKCVVSSVLVTDSFGKMIAIRR